MDFISTRNKKNKQSLATAIRAGLADDGGLFVPEVLPTLDLTPLSPDLSYADFSEKILRPFFEADVLQAHLSTICQQALNFPVPVKTLTETTFLLELFHGPTLSFKDVGARFLAGCLSRLSSESEGLTIMVATSGDTGSAVASAFYKQPHLNVIILYPRGQVSERQAHQITCFDDNVLALAVEGSFDHCQQLVKTAFQHPWWQQHQHLTSANSINIGRLLPQITYYAYTSLQFYRQQKSMPGFIVPTGNLGNATAAYYAKAMGFPIREIVLATNANRVISDYLLTGDYHPRQSISTLANAMDVGNPSNFERLRHLFPDFSEFKKHVSAISVTDVEIEQTIASCYREHATIICPHTATALFARQQLSHQPWIVVATADPSKFDTVIEPIIHTKVPVSPALQFLLDRPTHSIQVPPVLSKIEEVVKANLKLNEKFK